MRFQPSRIRVDNGHTDKLWYERYLYPRYSKIRNLKLDFDRRSALVSFCKETEDLLKKSRGKEFVNYCLV